MINLSIIIVSYNTKKITLRCLKSLGSLKLNAEIIVVDNGSRDGTIEEIQNAKFKMQKTRFSIATSAMRNDNSKFKIIRNDKNLGFAKANNLGIKASSGKYILLLNSDTVVFPETLVSMIQFMEINPKVGVATCRVELSDGSLDPACHRGFPTPWASLTYFLGLEKLFPKSKLFGQYHLGYLPMDHPHEIDSPTGAFYLVKREVIDQVGFLNEDYFMYGEDLDWSYRIKRAGWKIMYDPLVRIIHFKKQSGRENENREIRKKTKQYFYETMKIFYKKYYQNKYPQWLTNLIILAIEIKRRWS